MYYMGLFNPSVQKKNKSWFRIFKNESNKGRVRGFDIMNVFRVGGESRKSFKKRVAYYSGYRRKAPKSKFW